MTRVRMMTTASGPDWRCQAGQEIDLPSDTAAALIEGGFAQLVVEESAADEATDPEMDSDPGSAAWTSTPEEAARAEEAPVETATGGPQRQPVADDQVAAERAGREAAVAGAPLTANPHDGRSAMGRAWARGWKAESAE